MRSIWLMMLGAVCLGGGSAFGNSEGDRDPAWSIHFQSTAISQEHPGFHSPYEGMNSLSAHNEWDTSFTSTLFLGRALWKNGELVINPEVSAGSGFSGTHGVAGFPNGEIYRVDSPTPKPNLSRLYLKHFFELGGETESIEDDLNQVARKLFVRRITVVAGKFSLNDFLDANAYAHDPRTQFMNWGFMDNLAWDYAADTRGYTWGVLLEYNQEDFAIRFVTAMEPAEANQLDLDTKVLDAHGDNLELEYRYKAIARGGRLRLLAYNNHAHMGSYQQALDGTPDVTASRDYRSKYGFGLNVEQALTESLGAFARAGWNNGTTESWAFTEVDRMISFGLSLSGKSWDRAQDVVGLGAIINGLSSEHAAYLSNGGTGFLIGDGGLSYAPEQILEGYYLWKPWAFLGATLDFQFINHPGYNSERGPVEVASARLHLEL